MKNLKIETENQKEIPKISLFLTLWDDYYGPRIIDFHPTFNIGDLEQLSLRIFTFYQFFWENPNDSTYQRTYFTIPINKINRKARILFASKPKPEYGKGFQPYIVVLLLPDYIEDKDLEVYNEILLKISQDFLRESSEQYAIKTFFQEISEIFNSQFIDDDLSIEIDEYYSYTAAVEDFQAGIKLFQTKNYDNALSILKKVLSKFEKENHKHLIMEVLYIIGSILMQKRKFKSAKKKFKKLEVLANELNHEKYKELSLFLEGFCAYKNENFVSARKKFEKISILNSKYVNKLQYYTIYGRVLEHFESNEEALQNLLKALIITDGIKEKENIRNQQAQILYYLGIINYKIALENLNRLGISQKDLLSANLKETINYLNRAINILKNSKNNEKIIVLYQLIGSIYENLNQNNKALDFYRKILEITTEKTFRAKKVSMLTRIIQIQTHLGMYDKNIILLNEFFEQNNDTTYMDLFTVISLHNQLADSYIGNGENDKALSELLNTYRIIKDSKIYTINFIEIVKKIIQLYELINEDEKISYYKKELENIKKKFKKDPFIIQNPLNPLGSIKEIWLYSKSTGVCLYTYSPESKIDHDLLGGFLTAIQQFSVEFSQKEVHDMLIGYDRYMIYQEQNYDFYILGRASAKNSIDKIENLLSIIYRRFWKEFSQEINNFQGNIGPFKKFTQIIQSFDLTLFS
ncbi:MAG: tetratricopeptide repeat protein [Candidatus Hermodarchaeota archaeon]